MSVYNSNITTRILDPQFDRKNFRTEYRLNAGSVYLSNMRLVDMGYEGSDADSGFYNELLGAFCANSIQLYDGNKLLDQILEADLYKAFQTFNKSNDESLSVDSYLGQTDYGFAVTLDGDSWQNFVNQRANPLDIKVGPTGNTNTVGQKSWFSLKGFLPFLSASLYVPTTVFKNLRLVINWKSPQELKKISTLQNLAYNTFENTALIVDELNEGDAKTAAISNYKGVVFNAIEHDRVVVDEITPTADSKETQSKSFLVNGFNNKSVERLIAIQTPNNSTTYTNSLGAHVGGGPVCSMAQLNNTFQWRVNGSNKLPRDGYTRKNQRLAGLVDAMGECALPTGANFVYFPNALQQITYDPVTNSPLMSHLDWTAIEIREPVRELVVNYSRVGVAGNTKLNQQLLLNLFGECTKAISVSSDGSYIVQYL